MSKNEFNKELRPGSVRVNPDVQKQIYECLELVKKLFGKDLLGVYLYGSSVLGGLQKYSDIDLFVVLNRATTFEEKDKLVKALLKISGIYMKSKELPIEMTIVEKKEINPWRYPPKFDFQYGEWLRDRFELGEIEPWESKEMPDLALLVTQILLANHTIFGDSSDQLLCKVPYKDFMRAMIESFPNLMLELDTDTRNVLLALARIWSTLATDEIRSKPAAADWAINRLPEKYRLVVKRAQAICTGLEPESWDDLQEIIKPCADFMVCEANKKISEIMSLDNVSELDGRCIKLCKNYSGLK